MKVIFNENFAGVKSAVEMSNRLLKNPDFFKAIAAQARFDFSTASPQIIADSMASSGLEFKVEIFYPSILQRPKYRKTFAFTDSRYPNTLFLNFRKLNREAEDIAATIIHESVHALDDAEDQYTFGHGNNSPVGKENSGPYWIGNLAYRMLKNKPDAAPLPFFQIVE